MAVRPKRGRTAPPPVGPVGTVLRTIRARLLRQSAVFDDPRSYVAGVEDALDAVGRDLDDPGPVPTRQRPR